MAQYRVLNSDIRGFVGVAVWLLLAMSTARAGADWQTFTNCTLLVEEYHDADSFHVQAGDRTIHARLYFVDAPETSVSSDADAKRVRAQARHFGLTDPARVVHYGEAARRYVESVLAEPFTVQTTFAMALGRSSIPRVYALVTTAGGEDLATLLIKNGYARNYGVGRSLPDGTPGQDMEERLDDWQVLAMFRRRGIWADTDPEELVAMREAERREDRELNDLREHVSAEQLAELRVDLNTATARELQQLSGVGPVLAAGIIAGRPFARVDDLRRVSGINQRLLDSLRPWLEVAPPAAE